MTRDQVSGVSTGLILDLKDPDVVPPAGGDTHLQGGPVRSRRKRRRRKRRCVSVLPAVRFGSDPVGVLELSGSVQF